MTAHATTLGLATNRSHCAMCVKFKKEEKTILHIWLLKFDTG